MKDDINYEWYYFYCTSLLLLLQPLPLKKYCNSNSTLTLIPKNKNANCYTWGPNVVGATIKTSTLTLYQHTYLILGPPRLRRFWHVVVNMPPLRRVHMPLKVAHEFLQRDTTTCARKVHHKAMIARLVAVAGRRNLCKPIRSRLSTYRYASTLGSTRAFQDWQYTPKNRTAWSGRMWGTASFSSSSSGTLVSPLEEY